jgi:hypothetical protein
LVDLILPPIKYLLPEMLIPNNHEKLEIM